tara:strand:+ start:74 stop:619 length:546 start_codon:yes stop_codon:yes gene_type:complete
MIITCTECKKQFVVPDKAIPAEGRTVQCSSCSNEWRQFPLKEARVAKTEEVIVERKKPSPIKKKVPKKSKGPVPYSKEYMQQKWGSSLKSYAVEKGLTKKTNKIIKPKKIQKEKPVKVIEKPGFGFFNYIIVTSILIVAIVGTLDLTKTMIISNFPFLDPYIEHFFETINNLKIFILDFYR